MSYKIEKIYGAIVDGIESGLAEDELTRFVLENCPKATSKKIVRASQVSLSDAKLKDRNILAAIFAFAIKHRCDPLSKQEVKALKSSAAEKSEAGNLPSGEIEANEPSRNAPSPQITSLP